MAKQPASASEDATSEVKPVEPVITLDEFCRIASEQGSAGHRRPELIGAFHFVEKRHKRMRGTRSDYAARFEAFIQTPV